MSGLVTMEHDTSHTETVAGSEAYTKWLDGAFIDRNWRFFTASSRLRFFESYNQDEWDQMREYHAITHPRNVADYLQDQYNGLVLRQRY